MGFGQLPALFLRAKIPLLDRFGHARGHARRCQVTNLGRPTQSTRSTARRRTHSSAHQPCQRGQRLRDIRRPCGVDARSVRKSPDRANAQHGTGARDGARRPSRPAQSRLARRHVANFALGDIWRTGGGGRRIDAQHALLQPRPRNRRR